MNGRSIMLFRVVPEQRYFLLFLPGLETIIAALAHHAGSRRARPTQSILVVPVEVFGTILWRLMEKYSPAAHRAGSSAA